MILDIYPYPPTTASSTTVYLILLYKSNLKHKSHHCHRPWGQLASLMELSMTSAQCSWSVIQGSLLNLSSSTFKLYFRLQKVNMHLTPTKALIKSINYSYLLLSVSETSSPFYTEMQYHLNEDLSLCQRCFFYTEQNHCGVTLLCSSSQKGVTSRLASSVTILHKSGKSIS